MIVSEVVGTVGKAPADRVERFAEQSRPARADVTGQSHCIRGSPPNPAPDAQKNHRTKRSMSASSQKQTSVSQKAMSALPPISTAKADIRHVRFTPESRHVRCTGRCLLWANSGTSRLMAPLLDLFPTALIQTVGRVASCSFDNLSVAPFASRCIATSPPRCCMP